jgi:hypothetical protein
MPGQYIKGTPAFKARLKAIRTEVIKPTAAKWQDETVRIARGMVPNRGQRSFGYSTGALHDSIKAAETRTGRRARSAVEARVTMRYVGNFVDAGTQGHGLHSRATRAARGGNTGRTVFSRKGRKGRGGYPARPFKRESAVRALEKVPMAEILVKAWNEAA